MKRIVTIQDISCLGKCSLTVALPIISAMGVEASIIPTAVLSTHTQFSSFTFHDLTDEINKIKNHWLNEKFNFDAIYTGYLGSFEQLEIVSNFFDDFKNTNNKIIIDPVMGDNGKLYKGFSVEFAQSMAKLCSKADYILPNLTEASYMLGLDYYTGQHTVSYITDIVDKLLSLGAKNVILTGVSFNKNKLGVFAKKQGSSDYFYYEKDYIPTSYHGTGDIFASTFTGAITLGYSMEDALKIAVDYTVECIKITFNDNSSNTYGVDFERAIPYLISLI